MDTLNDSVNGIPTTLLTALIPTGYKWTRQFYSAVHFLRVLYKENINYKDQTSTVSEVGE